MDNLMTVVMEKVTELLIATDRKLKTYGATPYGTRKATHGEQEERIKNLTVDEMANLINTHGYDEVSKWLNRYRREKWTV